VPQNPTETKIFMTKLFETRA